MSMLSSLGVDVFMTRHAQRPGSRLYLVHVEPKWFNAQVGRLSFEASWGGFMNLRAFANTLAFKVTSAATVIGGWEALKLAA